MIWIPDRLAGLSENLEKGEPIDTTRLAALQVLDLVRAGRQFVIEAVQRQEETDEQLANLAGVKSRT